VLFGSIIFFAQSLLVTNVLVFLFGTLCSIRSVSAYIYILELVPKRYNSMLGSLFLFFDSFSLIGLAVYFKYISKDWHSMFHFYLALFIIASVIAIFMPQSPKQLLSKHRFAEARQSFNTIAWYNSKPPLDPDYDHFV
jgi:MFS family permease